MDRTPNLTERLLNPETVEAAIPALVQGIYQNIRANLAVPEVKAAVDAIRELHRRLEAAKAEGAAAQKYAAAPVDKGMPMHVYKAVCEQRDYELGERQRMTHRYEVEALRNRELERDLAAAREEIARRAEDSERMDWLEENPEAGEPYIVYHPPSSDITWRISATGDEFQSLRAAIDAARAGGTR